MKAATLKSLTAVALIAGLAMPVLAQDKPPAPPAAEKTAPDGKRGPHGERRHERGPRAGGMGQMGQHDPLALAERLSALETHVGITPDQATAWRGYTDALQAFVEAGRPSPPEKPPAPPEAGAKPPVPPLMAERMAAHALALHDKAEALQKATSDLRAVLTPEQLERLAKAERFAKKGPGPERGQHERKHGHKHDRDDGPRKSHPGKGPDGKGPDGKGHEGKGRDGRGDDGKAHPKPPRPEADGDAPPPAPKAE